ncbi:hypothetical protein [Amaricoccus tamworthensis]|uniref:hypothetical protein n=1 Tax=Amaricoccus tamworthensis TaxID=57002 RepID=UPI003C7E08AF
MMRALNVGFWKALQVIVFLATAPLVIGSQLLSLGAGVLIGGLVGIVLTALLLEPHEGQIVWDLLIIVPCMIGGTDGCLAIWIDYNGVVKFLVRPQRDSHGTA